MSISFTGPHNFAAEITKVGMYSDNTPMVKTDQWGSIVRNADTIIMRPWGLLDLMTGLFLVDSANATAGAQGIKRLILPYLPGARQDRSNPTGDVLFTAKSVAQMINDRNFDAVVVIDPHSPMMPGLINNVVEFPLENIAKKLWPGMTGIIAPDTGAKHRAQVFANTIGKPIAYGWKQRDVSTGKLTGFAINGLQEGGHYLVVDDICDGGGTFVGLGEKIRDAGAYADLYVTHGIFSKGTRHLHEIYKNIFTTDSLFQEADHKVLTIPVVKDMENYNA